MKLTFLGSGDAFGSGGRFNTCFHVRRDQGPAFLIDCGATSLVALRKAGLSPNDIGTIFLTHLHGDHFGGLPFLILDGQFARRATPLTIVGPKGLPGRLAALQEAMYPGSSRMALRYPLDLVEIAPGEPATVDGAAVSASRALHDSGTPSLSLRIEADGRALCYSGDTAWTDALIETARGADVFICEAYFHGRQVPGHMDVADLLPRLREIAARRVVFTHMTEGVMAEAPPPGVIAAFDGLEIEL